MLGVASSDLRRTVLCVSLWTVFAGDFAAGPRQRAPFLSWRLLPLHWDLQWVPSELHPDNNSVVCILHS